MTLKRQIGEAYMRYKLRVAIGQSYTSEIDGIKNALTAGGVVILLVDKYFHVLLPWWVMLIAWGLQKGVEYLLGYADEHWLHMTAYSNNYQAEHLNPYQKEIKDRLIDIQKRLDNKS